jgi:hypothetical protein
VIDAGGTHHKPLKHRPVAPRARRKTYIRSLRLRAYRQPAWSSSNAHQRKSYAPPSSAVDPCSQSTVRTERMYFVGGRRGPDAVYRGRHFLGGRFAGLKSLYPQSPQLRSNRFSNLARAGYLSIKPPPHLPASHRFAPLTSRLSIVPRDTATARKAPSRYLGRSCEGRFRRSVQLTQWLGRLVTHCADGRTRANQLFDLLVQLPE